MKKRGRKIMSVLAVVAGLVLGVFEAANAANTPAGELWFWSAVAALLTVIGMADLLSSDDKK